MRYSFLLALVFLAVLAVAAVAGKVHPAVAGLYTVASAVAFVAYALDKSAARSRQWRIRERTLHLFSLAGGWPGALCAQCLLRHKSKKASFQMTFWLTVAINCGALAWLLVSFGPFAA
jgi:uncharacterized membrane protein YsdA (DUF1294 family)